MLTVMLVITTLGGTVWAQPLIVKGTVTVYESIVSYEPAQIFEITSEERPIENESD